MTQVRAHLDVSGTKCAEVLFLLAWNTHVWSMLQLRCLPSVNSSSLTHSAADVQQKSCIVTTPLWTWLDLYSQYATLSLIIVGYWFLCESNDLSAAGGNGQRAMHCMKARLSFYLSTWWFYHAGNIQRWRAVIVLLVLWGRAGIKAGYGLGRHSVRQEVNLWVS